MTFLNFGALFGLAAVSIPIIIHLLNKMQVREMPWAAMRFLKETVEKNSRRLQMEDIILLILRCLLIALLVLVLSRPTWQSNSKSSGAHQVTAVLIIDDSYSMGLTNGIQTRLERAQTAAEQILQAFPTGSSAALYFAADNVQPVIAQPTYDFNLLRKSIRDAKLTDRATDLTNALQMAVTMLKKHDSAGSKDVYLITDGQANGFPSIDQLEKQLEEISKDVNVHLVLVGDAAESNLGVTDLHLDGGLTPVNQQLRCSVQVLNGSASEVRDVRVSISVDGQPSTDEKIIPSIAPGQAAGVSLFTKLRTDGYHYITAKIPPDRLPADDQRTVAVRAIRDVKVLLVNGATATNPSRSDDFFVRNALVPVAPGETAQYFIHTTTTTAAQLGSTPLDSYDAVFLLNVNSFDASAISTLVNYVRQGGGLVIFPGPEADLDFYKRLGQDSFLPAEVSTQQGHADQQTKFFSLQTKDYDHPIADLWNDSASGTLLPIHVYAYYKLVPRPWKAPAKGDPASTAGQPRVVLHYDKSDDPLAIEQTYGTGRVVLFSTTATTAWNDFPIHQAFVPLMHRVLGALLERADEGLNVRVGQKFSYGVSTDLLRKDVTVVSPGQTTPPRVSGQVALIDGVPTVQYDDTDVSGPYRVTLGSESSGSVIYFAAQSDPSESNLTPLSDDQLKLIGSVADVIKWSPDAKDNLTPKITAARVGHEFWFPLLITALILATLETFFAQRFSQSK